VDDRFVPLAKYLRATAAPLPAPRASDMMASATAEFAPSMSPAIVDFAHAGIVADLTMMRLAALEAFERNARLLIADLAHDVLGRELALAPTDIDALVTRALAAFARSEPVAVAVAPNDCDRVHTPLPIRADPALSVGDLVVYVDDGAFESPFAFRLADALARLERDA